MFKIKILFFSALLCSQVYVVFSSDKSAAPHIEDWKITIGNDGKIEFEITSRMKPGTTNGLVHIIDVDTMGILRGDGTAKVKGIVNFSGVVENFANKLCDNLQFYEKRILIGAVVAGVAWLGCYWGVEKIGKEDSKIPYKKRLCDGINQLKKTARFATKVFLGFACLTYFLRKKILPNLNHSIAKIFLESVVK